MIKFKTITWKNFLSTGNTPIEIALNDFSAQKTTQRYTKRQLMQQHLRKILKDPDIIIPDTSILIGSYISFAKNKIVNTSSLLGYYAEMIFINEDNEKKVELFSVGSEIEESSK